MKPHAMTIEETLRHYEVSPKSGLSAEEVVKRQKEARKRSGSSSAVSIALADRSAAFARWLKTMPIATTF